MLYLVTFLKSVSFEIEADSEQEAEEIAQEDFDDDQDAEWFVGGVECIEEA